eukprot:TRINITY_DN803_c0_g1_i1.p1 TRINITY_DN803_c0_g1~~TRINITY_DN803_c0_g1_i1.p1  ORF type:complete len:940 (+),score=167.99 TRINITY_DN803_c0_g1_i1:28-2820(+)
MAQTKFAHFVSRSWSRLGLHWVNFLIKYPIISLIALFAFTAFCATGFPRKQENLSTSIWLPTNSYGVSANEKYYDVAFRSTNSTYFILLTFHNTELYSKDNLVKAYNMRQKVLDFNGPITTVNYTSICQRLGTSMPCVMIDPFFCYKNVTELQNDNNYLQNITKCVNNTAASGVKIGLDGFGGLEMENNYIKKFHTLSLTLTVNKAYRTYAYPFFLELNTYGKTFEKSNVEFGVLTMVAFQSELTSMLANDINRVIYSFILMFAYLLFFLGKFCHPTQSRIYLSLQGIIVVACSIVTGLGLSYYLNIVETYISQIVPLLLLGLSLDEQFLLVDSSTSYLTKKKDIYLNPKEALAKHFSHSINHVLPSVTMTSVTDACAFLLGTMSPIYAISQFCKSASICVFFVWFYHVSMFVIFLYWDNYRMMSNYSSFLPCKKVVTNDVVESNDDGKMLNLQVEIQSNPIATPSEPFALQTPSTFSDNRISTGTPINVRELKTITVDGRISTIGNADDDEDDEFDHELSEEYVDQCIAHETGISGFLGRKYVPFVTKPVVSVIIIIIFTGMLVFGFLNMDKIPTDLPEYLLLPSESLPAIALTHNTYIPSSDEYSFVSFNYTWSKEWFDKMNTTAYQYLNDSRYSFISHTWVVDSARLWGLANRASCMNSTTLYFASEACAHSVMIDFYTIYNSQYVNGMYIKNNKVKSTVITFKTIKMVNNKKKQIEIYQNLIDGTSSLTDVFKDYANYQDSITFMFSTVLGLYDQSLIAIPSTTSTVAQALIAIFIFTIVFVGKPVLALILTVFVFVVNSCLIFWMVLKGMLSSSAGGTRLDPVASIVIILSVGLSVDYQAHIMHAFSSVNPKVSAVKRLQYSLCSVGMSVFNGAFTTFLGISLVGFSDAMVFQTFFWMFLFVIGTGIICAFTLMPAVFRFFPSHE